MQFLSTLTLDAFAVAGVFAASGIVHLSGAGFVRRAYARWHFPPKFYRVTGLLNLLAAIFLMMPVTRIWGAALAAFVTFVAVVTLLNNRQYAYSLPAMLLLAALIPATLAGPI
jgi:hypothetical protein